MKDLIQVFKDTKEISNKIPNTSVTTKHGIDDILMFVAIGNTVGRKKEIKNNVTVENSDTVSSLVEWSKKGKTCILNMASFKRPGGGVENGARAQEECLFRCSNLFNVVSKEHYPLDECTNTGEVNYALYTNNAKFFKDFNYDWMDPVECDVVTIAAINLNSNARYDPILTAVNGGLSSNGYESKTKEKIRLMLSLAHTNGAKNIILGAWGCGVFNNDPVKMSKFFKEVLIDETYSTLFDNVVFAIINDHNSVGNNFDIFNDTFKGVKTYSDNLENPTK